MRKFFESWPMAAVLWVWLTAGILVEFNRFYPDLLFHPMGL
ncbi:MAG: photosystem I reaction center subunit IX [Cyanobacteriota bacterium]|nr:photosystem I reaction center subunit IX [Cyanobacteriota bacterium]MED5562190.1 photosystem I reaction center subunit IX [Cyanobacteriota bacterium]